LDKPFYSNFGAFLNAVYESAVGDLSLDPVVVRDRIDFWLDRQHLAEYSAKCVSGGCSGDDVEEVADLIKRSIEENVPFPPYKKKTTGEEFN
jgi:hypothetical protein